MDRVFVDSDIIIDFFADRGEHANAASLLFDLRERNQIRLCTSVLVIANVYYILRKNVGHDRAILVISELLRLIDILSVTSKHLLSAMSTGFKEYEDSIQYAVALDEDDIDAILTRNIKDYKKSKIAVMTAENYIRYKINKEE